MWNFLTYPEFRKKHDWMEQFVREECEALDIVCPGHGKSAEGLFPSENITSRLAAARARFIGALAA